MIVRWAIPVLPLLCLSVPLAQEGMEQWYEVRAEIQYRPDRSGVVRMVFRRDWLTDIHFYFYDGAGSQPILYASFRSVGYLLDVRTVPDPQNADQELLLFYTAAQYPVGHLWRIDPERGRILRVLEGTYLDTAYLVTKQLVTQWKPAHYVLGEGLYDFQLMARRLWRWDERRLRFVPSWWRVAEPTCRFFDWMDKITDQYDKLGTPCPPPEPLSAEKTARFDYYTLWQKGFLDNSGTQYHVQVACNEEEVYLSVYKPLAKGLRLLRCTKLDWLGGLVISLQAVPNPDNPSRSLMFACDENGWCKIWRVDPKTMRPVMVLDGSLLDVSRIREGIVKEWTQALSLVKDAGWDAYSPAFRNPKAMAYRVWRWDKRKQQFVVASSWRIGKWSRADYRRFGFWE